MSQFDAPPQDPQQRIAELEQRIAELERRQAESHAAAAAQADFVAHISHELRTPMNGILGMTRLALETELNQEQRECLEVVYSSAQSLLTLVNDLLDQAKIDAGSLALERIPFDLPRLFTATLDGVRVLADHKHLDLSVEIDPDVPERAVGDPTRLRQVLLNLVGNAIKFTDEGGVAVHVAADEATATGPVVRVSVTDTGIGIPADRIDDIFQPFMQADASTTRRYGGTGLGLAITKRLVELMGGSIFVTSEPGSGSTFTFTVQLELPAPSVADPAPTDMPTGVDVLVVSDGPVNREVLADVLAESRMRPRIVEDPVTALHALRKARERETPYGLVVLDLQRNGLDTAWEIKREAIGTPMILLTPSGQRGDAARCREIGIGGYLTGAVVAADLADTIQAVLAGTPDLITRYWLREHRHALNIVVADDSATNRLLLTKILEKRGHNVIGVANGAEAVDAVAQRDIDVALLDIHMPIMDGYQATAAIRALGSTKGTIPLIAVTGSVNEEGKRRCLEAGMDAFVAKPFNNEELLELIEALVKKV